jgi:exodeoxyribonuclease VII large subunit
VARQERRLGDLVRARVTDGRSRLARGAGKLDSLSPLAVLSRGYALVWDENGRLVRDPTDVRAGDPLRVRVAGGELPAVVTGRERA